jgi:hypothetical protein
VAEAWQRQLWPDSKQLRLVAISFKLVFYYQIVTASSLESAQRMLGAQEGSCLWAGLVAEAWQRRFWPDSKQLRLVAISLKLAFFNTNVIASSLQSAQRMLGAQEGSCFWAGLVAEAWQRQFWPDSKRIRLMATNLKLVFYNTIVIASSLESALRMLGAQEGSCFWAGLVAEAWQKQFRPDSKQFRLVAISLNLVFYNTNVIASLVESALRM